MTAAVLFGSFLLIVQPGDPPSLTLPLLTHCNVKSNGCPGGTEGGGSSLVEERLEAVRKAPADPRARLELGVAYAQAEEYDLAMAELVEAIKLNPENRDNLSGQANYHLGTVLMMLDRAALAANAFREALRLGWTDVSVYLGLAQAFSKQGKFEEAALQYREALRLVPQMTGLHASLALMLEASGQIDEAITHYELYLRSAPAEAQHGIEVIRQRLATLKERRKM